MQIGGFLQQLVLEVLSVLPVKQELQVRQVRKRKIASTFSKLSYVR